MKSGAAASKIFCAVTKNNTTKNNIRNVQPIGIEKFTKGADIRSQNSRVYFSWHWIGEDLDKKKDASDAHIPCLKFLPLTTLQTLQVCKNYTDTSCIVEGPRARARGFRQGKDIYLFSKASRATQTPNQPLFNG